jgi:aminopeptidase N
MTDFHDYLEALMHGDLREAEEMLLGGREQFTFATAKPQWAPPRKYDIQHLKMDFKLDLKNEHVDAVSVLKIKCIAPKADKLFLHAAELDISSIKDSAGNELDWDLRSDDESMYLFLKRSLNDGDEEELTFTYAIDCPREGFHFTNPSPEFPEIETSIWTQMQDDYARYVVPVYDNPSHKFSVETTVTVPEGYYAMGNGVLKERKNNGDGTETFHWYNERPMPAYLITIAASEYIEYKEDVDGIEVSYYVHKKWDKDTVYRSFGKTPAMMKFFMDKLGVGYPWDKYAQVTAADFSAGGMENVSATTQSDATLHDEKAHKDFDSDGLVSHELAHMWGGDLVTCRTWSHGWLNEGWANQMQNEWKRHDKGDDEYLYEQYQKQVAYFTEDKTKYRRPLVQNEWERGMDVFDRHLYPGGGWRYYMLKHLVGEDRWWKILGAYLKRHSYKSVYTHDLETIFTEMTGEDYGWFFEQWLYKAGYPECKIKVSDDAKSGHTLVKIEQIQKHKDGMTPKVFRFPMTVEFVDEDGERNRYTMEVTERIHSFYFPNKERPKQVIIDPDYAVLMDWKIEKPESMWIEQLKKGVNIVQRLKAAKALGKKATPKAIEALGEALVKESFWGVAVEVAKTLGSIKNESALTELLRGIKLENSRARTAVAQSLGLYYKNDRAFEGLKTLLGDQDSYWVVSSAAAGIGKTQHDDAFDVLSSGIKSAPQSWHHIIEQGYLSGLAATEKEDAIDIIKEFTELGVTNDLRRVAPIHLARLGKRYKKQQPEIKSYLERLIHDKSYRVRLAALVGVREYEDASLIPALAKLAESAVEGFVIRLSRIAMRALSKRKEPEELDSLRKSVEELEKENRDLKDRLSKVEVMFKKHEEHDD